MEKIECPACGQQQGVPLLWGSPDAAGTQAIRRGESVWAGCMIEPAGDAAPDFACLACSHRWRDDLS